MTSMKTSRIVVCFRRGHRVGFSWLWRSSTTQRMPLWIGTTAFGSTIYPYSTILEFHMTGYLLNTVLVQRAPDDFASFHSRISHCSLPVTGITKLRSQITFSLFTHDQIDRPEGVVWRSLYLRLGPQTQLDPMATPEVLNTISSTLSSSYPAISSISADATDASSAQDSYSEPDKVLYNAIIATNSISLAACIFTVSMYIFLRRKNPRLMSRTSLKLSIAMACSDAILHVRPPRC